jgi:hypothetical protein
MMHGRLGTLDDVGYIYPPRAVLNLVIALIDDDAVSEIYNTVKVSLYSKIREGLCLRKSRTADSLSTRSQKAFYQC